MVYGSYMLIRIQKAVNIQFSHYLLYQLYNNFGRNTTQTFEGEGVNERWWTFYTMVESL